MTLTDTTQAPYTPLIWDATLPGAEGMIATHYHNNLPTNDQVQQSAALFRLIIAQDQSAFDALQSITMLAVMLIQNPGKNRVHFIMGKAKFLADPIRHPTGHPLQEGSSFLAIGEDLVEPADTPQAIILPDNVLKTSMVNIPMAPQFIAKITQKAAELPDGGTAAGAQFDSTPCQWFKHSDAGTILCPLTKMCPLPHFLAYDAFLDNVTVHIIWERIAFHEDKQGGAGRGQGILPPEPGQDEASRHQDKILGVSKGGGGDCPPHHIRIQTQSTHGKTQGQQECLRDPKPLLACSNLQQMHLQEQLSQGP